VEHLELAYDLRQTVTDRERYQLEASYFGHLGELEKAIEILKVLVSLYPDDVESRRTLASCYREMGQIPKAVSQLREVLRLHPYDVHASTGLILLLAMNNQCEEAIQVYRKAGEYGTKSPELRWGLGLAYLGLGKIQEAREQFKTLQSEEGAYKVIGEVYDVRTTLYQGKFAEAIKQLNLGILQDIKAGNKYPELLRRYLLANTFVVLNRPEEATEQLQKIISTSPKDLLGEDVRRAGSLLARIGKESQALEAMKVMEILLKEFPIAYYRSCQLNLKGEIFLAQQRPKQAIQSFLTAYVERPLVASHHGMARAYLQLGDLKNAAVEWKRAVDSRGEFLQDGFPPEWILAHLELARVYQRLNNPTLSAQYYQQFLTIWQNADAMPIRDEAVRELNELKNQKELNAASAK
ncbi:tetratricopeptide repeat protein, partial [bacterium]|nr:tetratricopeptide repeat protein [bacterium]